MAQEMLTSKVAVELEARLRLATKMSKEGGLLHNDSVQFVDHLKVYTLAAVSMLGFHQPGEDD